jgi:hypothetical protein
MCDSSASWGVASRRRRLIEQAEKFELLVNLRTARTLGVTRSPSLLGRMDQVLE